MALPAAIRKQVEETDAQYGKDGELKGPNESGENLEELGETTPSTDGNVPTGETTQVNDSETTTPSTDTSSGQQAQQPSGDELSLMQQRYSSLQGMYNSAEARSREQSAQIEQLRQALSTLQTPAPAVPALQKPMSTGVTKEEREEYSEPFFDMMDRYVGSKLDPVLRQLDSMQGVPQAFGQLNDQIQHLVSAQGQTNEGQFFDGLARSHPDWEQVNNSPQFAKWLQVVEPLSGVTRQVLLDDARKRLDLNLAVNSFAEFKATTDVTGKAGQNKSQKEGLAQQAVVNPKRGQGSIPVDTTKKTYTKVDLDTLYSDQRRGKYKNKEDEFKAQEAQLLQAIAEGRYTQ